MSAPNFTLRGKPLKRCLRCALPLSLCVCGLIKPVDIRTRVTVLCHIKEWVRTSNSGRLLNLVLTNSEVRIRGQKDRPMSSIGLVPENCRNVVLFPSERSEVLSLAWLERDCRPIHLVVPDGNWRQATRMMKRVSILSTLPHVRLPNGPPSRFRLRMYPDVTRISTFESVARALGIIESSATQSELEKLFDIAVERALWSRGKLTAQEVSGGIPESAFSA